jgi:Peptidase S24-like
MRVIGDCMMPEIADNDLLHFDKHEPVKAGDMVAIFLRPELLSPGELQVRVKRLATDIPHWVTFPYQDHPDSDVHALIIAEMLNPRRRFMVKCSSVLAVHKCLGHLPLEQRTPGPCIPAPKLTRQRRMGDANV